MSQFADQVEIKVKAGNGGNGKLSFRHEKYKAKAGPDGGDGGHGGDIYIVVNPEINTLSYFLSHKEIKAEEGIAGEKEKQTGKSGEDKIIEVPSGTVIYDSKNKDLILDTVSLGVNEKFLLARGGRGGFGNAHFTTSTRQKPEFRELGEQGEEKTIFLELKLVADVGIIGLPNAGKSTLLSVISNKKPEIAAYPFTTITPNLGVVNYKGASFVAADIPGLIEGASKGKGLGFDFLRHIERTKVLVHIIDGTSDDYLRDYDLIIKELKSFSKEIIKKPSIVVINKTEVLQADELKAKSKALIKKIKTEPVLISAATAKGLNELLDRVVVSLQNIPKKKIVKEEEIKVYTTADFPEHFEIKKKKTFYIVSGQKIEKLAERTDFSNDFAIARLRDVLKREGITSSLKKTGAKEGDRIRIAGRSFLL